MTSAADFLLELAVQRGLVAAAEVDRVRERLLGGGEDTLPPGALVEALLADGRLSERMLAELAASEAAMPFVDADALHPKEEALRLVPRALAERHTVLPLAIRGNALHIAVADPLELEVLDAIAETVGRPVEPAVAAASAIRAAIARCYAPGEGSAGAVIPTATPANVPRTSSAPRSEGGADAGDVAEAPIIQLVERVIRAAVARGASDVHWEPLAQRFRVRFRIDGSLVEVEDVPKQLQAAIVSRLKLMAHLSIAEKRLPQDGRAQLVLGEERIDLRVSSIPSVHGESIVMRLLQPGGLRVGLAELGLGPEDEEVFQRLLAIPDGMLLVTGPTGSGKTTTLYTCLHHLNRPDRKIITVEDPIEYRLSGINQVPVRTDIGMTFAAALRAMLRQAPNVIMLGEIRDRETADNAVNAALTGHVVFSTLHTNDAPGAVTRLVDLGVKPFLVASAVRAVVAQRLVRRVCAACAQPTQATAAELADLGCSADFVRGATLVRGEGCEVCHGSGYRGRLGLFELFVVDESIQTLIHEGATTAALREAARLRGMRTLREDGLRKALAGQTTLEEIISSTVEDRS